MKEGRREALLKEYEQVSNNFRTLTDIRFRMLSLLPIATAVVAVTAVIKGELTSVGSLTFSLFGLATTIGLATYNARNDQLYNELVGRAASIERSLGLPDGSFANRPKAWLTIRWKGFRWKVNHGTAIETIYAASIALWLSLILSSILELSVPDPSVGINGIALVLAITITYIGYNSIKEHVNNRENELRILAARAYRTALSLNDVRMALCDPDFITECAKLANDTYEKNTLARAHFYARVNPDSLDHYVLLGSKEQSAAHLVALLTDFPPGWVLNSGEDRLGKAQCNASAATSYTSGSVFTVTLTRNRTNRRHDVAPGLADTTPNEPWFHVAVVQFKDDGGLARSSHVDEAIALIRSARRSTPDGAVVVVFIHGWHHNAAWNRSPSTLATDADGDDHFHSFRLTLESLAIREFERSQWRQVVGLYLSWNGEPVGGFGGMLSKLWGLTHITFWNRYPVAQRIGAGTAFQDALRRIITATKEPTPVAEDQPSVSVPDSPLIMIGHSMGALMLESGLLALLTDPHQPLMRQDQSLNLGPVQLKSGKDPILLPNLILAINSAANSCIIKDIQKALEKHKLEKTAVDGDISYSPPIMMSVTSTGDIDTRCIWRLAQGFYAPWRKTDGHDSSVLTHNFILTAADSICQKRPHVLDFGQNWHCLRKPIPLIAPSPTISIDLPVRERDGVTDESVPHARYTITPRGAPSQPRLIWAFQVSPEVIEDHNDIFNSKARSLILALIQISGAVASLAEDVLDNFEEE